MGDIHGIIAQKLEILTEITGLQPALCAIFAQQAHHAQEKSPVCAQTGGVRFLILFGQYRIILGANTVNEARRMLSQKRR